MDYCRNILAIKFSPDSNLIASASLDFSVKLWTWNEECKLKLIVSLIGHTNLASKGVFIQEDKLLLLTESLDYQVLIWELESFALVKTIN